MKNQNLIRKNTLCKKTWIFYTRRIEWMKTKNKSFTADIKFKVVCFVGKCSKKPLEENITKSNLLFDT